MKELHHVKVVADKTGIVPSVTIDGMSVTGLRGIKIDLSMDSLPVITLEVTVEMVEVEIDGLMAIEPK